MSCFNRKFLFHFFSSLCLTSVLLYAVFWQEDISSFKSLIVNVNGRLVSFYVVLSISALIFRALRYRVIVMDVAGFKQCPNVLSFFTVTALRNAFVDLLPARLGELSFLYFLNRYGVSLVTGGTTFALCFLLDVVVLFLLFFIVAATNDAKYLLVYLLGVVGLTVILFYLLRTGTFFRYIVNKLRRYRTTTNFKFLEKSLHTIELILSDAALQLDKVKKSGHVFRLFAYTFALRALKYVSLYILLLAVVDQYGFSFRDLNPFLTSVAFITAEAVASLPISGIMGFGSYELTWTMVFKLIKSPAFEIMRVIFVVHIISQIVGYFFGFIGFIFFWIKILVGKDNDRTI